MPRYFSAMGVDLRLAHDLLSLEIFPAEGNPRKAIDVLEKMSTSGPSSDFFAFYAPGDVFYNTPFLRDAPARAYAKSGDLDKAIAEYERLITFDLKSEARLLIHRENSLTSS